MKYFAPYSRELGFKISVDGFHNTPHPIPYGWIVSLNPPGSLYTQEQEGPARDVNIASTLDYASPLRSFHLLDGFFNYRDIPGEQQLAAVFDVRSIEFVGGNPKIVEAGWAVIPIFFSRDLKLYVRSGVYQIPLLKGKPTPELIKEMSTYEDQWNFIQNLLSERQIALNEPFSAIIRIWDGQREGHFSRLYDYNRLDYSFMPLETKNPNFLFSPASLIKFNKMPKLSSVVPKRTDGSNFQKSLTDAFVQKFGLTQFETD